MNAVVKAPAERSGDADLRANAEWCVGKWRHAGRPRQLPLELGIEDLGLSIASLRSSLRDRRALGSPTADSNPAECKLGFYNPPFGRMLGMALAPRIGALLSRPGCTFNNSFVWQYDRGSDMALHVDRPPLDITMSVPVSLDGADAWPVRVRQPDDEIIEWPSKPGSVLIFDGRWRPHWRDPFHGRRALVLLLHWRAPAVHWSELLDADQRRQISAGALGPQCGWAELLESATALARLAVPRSATLKLQRVDLPAQTLPDRADGSQPKGVIFLAPLDDHLALSFDRGTLTMAPGDAVAFAARDECCVDWADGGGTGKVLLGRAHADTVDAPAGKYD